LDKWCRYYDQHGIKLHISRKQQMMIFEMPTLNRSFYQTIKIQSIKEISKNQLKARQAWGCLGER
jgi:oligoribonuclease (3'-5' exoribonuclease)